MTSNDRILLDAILDTWAEAYALSERPREEVFELFSATQVTSSLAPTLDQVERSIVDGEGDGGIDAVLVVLDGEIVETQADEISDTYEPGAIRRGVELELIVVQSKLQQGFSENHLTLLGSNLSELLDLSVPRERLESRFNDGLLDRIFTFRELWQRLLTRRPSVSLSVHYVTRGGTEGIHARVEAEQERVRVALEESLAGGQATIVLTGARELCDLASTVPSYDRRVTVKEFFADGQSYVCLIGLREYFALITEDGELIRHLFDQNVRDWEGNVAVNNAIRETLDNPDSPEFWWLNNGITIICDAVSAAGRTLVVEGLQIVNGQQTSMAIAHYLSSIEDDAEDARSVLVRVVQTTDESVRDAIIRATNKQTPVPEAALRSTDTIHRDIEAYLLSVGLHYERRKNYYRNLGRPPATIVGVSYLAQAVSAIGFSDPGNARARPSSLLKNDATYDRLFSGITMEVYGKIARLQLEIDRILKLNTVNCTTSERTNVRYYVSMLLAARAAGARVVHPQQLAGVDLAVTEAAVQEALDVVRDVLADAMVSSGESADKLAKSSRLCELVLARASAP